MNRLISGCLVAGCLSLFPAASTAGVNENNVQKIVAKYVPKHSRFKKPVVNKVAINAKTKTITIDCNDATAYIPLTSEEVAQIKADSKEALGSQYAAYKVVMKVGRHTLDELAIDAEYEGVTPAEQNRFITPLDKLPAPKGMDGSNITLWQSHGRYYSEGSDEWEWQRARLWETVEDLFTQSYVMPYLMPMLENAGAYVLSPRERDIRTQEYVADNDKGTSGTDYVEKNGTKKWEKSSQAGFAHPGKSLTAGVNPFRLGSARTVGTVTDESHESTASWNATFDEPGDYAVYVSYQSLPNSAPDAIYTVNAANGAHNIQVNQQMGGGTWIYLGHFPFEKGKSDKPVVQLSNYSDGANYVVSADAVKIGGGYGNVARGQKSANKSSHATSGYPRFTEGARYWLQWAGAPEAVYNESGADKDYKDDYRSRGLWVNWLAGGSSVLPDETGLRIPIDMSLGFHSDAGITKNDSIIGTLGIYCTDNQKEYPNGMPRLASRDLTNKVMTNITDDVRALFEPNWSRRGMWDSEYAEARRPQVPAMLLELLSHQNFADMRYGLDPNFRFAVSRAIYKGMLQFLAKRDGREYVVQPLPVNSFGIESIGEGRYLLSWEATEDKLESTATPTYYIVEERVGDNVGFTELAIVDYPQYELEVEDNEIHTYRIIAGNDGGVSFPSESLALRYKPGAPQVLIVNGFTRVSAPDSFDYGNLAGFDDARDHGVPYIKDISYIGSQYEFRRNVDWMSDEVAGLGASRSNYEDKVVAGNTFDYPYLHGQSIAHAGYGFVSKSADAFIVCDNDSTYATVDLILGKQKEIKIGTGKYGTRYKTFTEPLQQRLRQFADAGGNIFVSGAFIATDLWNNPYSTKATANQDQAFAQNVLGYKWRAGQAAVEGKLKEKKYACFGNKTFEFVNELNSETYAVESPDAVAPANKNAAAVMIYTENNLTAATAYSPGNYRAVAMGVPFEAIRGNDSRNVLMGQILQFLNQKR